ncbi:FkbM family methyltransferase [Allomesorhizobium camelthorni]|uniref:FkbM family methyltransferase n=1 Tax=Allomesorhizobium camelthorni TaxID=475069 RepID=A0A6G4WDP9_9HYPH|nr:FkbM family methyltransferase [Mesorhizobium camelthorni]NGO52237.1 FkbM family methyltransferase [Mesorhizobium camelthorni]
MQQPERPTRDFQTLFRRVKALGFQPEICIDVGAAGGTGVIYEAFRDALHVAFEPLPDFREQLAKRLSGFKHKIYNCAVMDRDGEMEILRTEQNVLGSSLMHRRSGTDDSRLLTVPVRTLDGVMGDPQPEGQILLKTDCQGADLLVIKGGTETLKRCELVIMETSLFRFWGPHQHDFADTVTFMKDHGFVVYDIVDGIFRPLDAALGQIDLVFVKEDGMFRQKSGWQ